MRRIWVVPSSPRAIPSYGVRPEWRCCPNHASVAPNTSQLSILGRNEMTKTAIALALAALTMVGAPAARAADDYTVNVVVPLTGGAAFVGGGQKDTLNALAEVVNKAGGIQNHKLVFSFHD